MAPALHNAMVKFELKCKQPNFSKRGCNVVITSYCLHNIRLRIKYWWAIQILLACVFMRVLLWAVYFPHRCGLSPSWKSPPSFRFVQNLACRFTGYFPPQAVLAQTKDSLYVLIPDTYPWLYRNSPRTLTVDERHHIIAVSNLLLLTDVATDLHTSMFVSSWAWLWSHFYQVNQGKEKWIAVWLNQSVTSEPC